MPKHPAINTPRNAPQDGRAQGRRVALPPCPWSSWKVGKVEKVNTKRKPEGKKRVASDTLAAEPFEVARKYSRFRPRMAREVQLDYPQTTSRPERRPRAEWSRNCLSPLALPLGGISRHTEPESSGAVLPAPCPGRLRHPYPARTRCPTWLIIPLVVLGTFSRRSSKKTFMWLKNPLAVAQKSPPCGSKIPLWIGRQGWREGITRFTEGTCCSLASRLADGPPCELHGFGRI